MWKFCPKTIFAGRDVVKVAVNLSTISFNTGAAGILNGMRVLGTIPG